MSASKSALTGLAALTLLDLAASAASAQNWTGAYIGLHSGARIGEVTLSHGPYILSNPIDLDPAVPAQSRSFSLDGAIVGLHTGYNFILGTNILLGIESDVSTGSARDEKSRTILIDGIAYALNSRAELDWQASLRARLGFTAGPWLFYTTAGIAITAFDWTETFSRPGVFAATVSQSDMRTGFVVGAGTEWTITGNWILRTEYLFEDFGSFKVPLAAALPVGTTGNVDLEVHKVRLGVSYKF
jgi:opacity protein-like surface antigen